MNRAENRRDFLRFNDAVQRARLEYARTLNEIEAPPKRHADCGTVAGRRRHYREKTPVCDDCRAAYNEANRERRAAKKARQNETRRLEPAPRKEATIEASPGPRTWRSADQGSDRLPDTRHEGA